MADKKTNMNTRRMSGLSGSARKSGKSDENHVNVAVRCRPMSEKENSDGHQSIVEFESQQRIVVHDTSAAPSDQLGTKSGERQNYSHVYDFDYVFDCDSTQKGVYDQVCRPIVDSVLEGYNGTIFAYGQTGTGKTYTMEGLVDSRRLSAKQSQKARKESLRSNKDGNESVDSKSQQSPISSGENQKGVGIIPRTFEQIFDHIAKHPEIQFLVRASYLEIYQEDIHDLLRKDRSIKLELHERPDIGVYVKDLTSFVCKSIAEIGRVMKVGNQNRKVGATDMNEHSSRSHAIFMITVEQQSTIGDKGQSEKDNRVIRVGKLNLVDLAGSERQRKTNSFGERQRESIKINLSLSALGNVINSLMKISTQQQQSNNKVEGNKKQTNDSFTPYRDSKLTRLLQDSLGGNAKTLMIANIGPASYNYDETINTLNYASRAKCIRNKPRLNEDPKDALLRELQREIDDLRSKLAAMGSDSTLATDSGERLLMNHARKGDRATSNLQSNSAELEQPLVEKELIALRQKLSSLEGKLLNGDKSASKTLDKRLLQGYTRDQELALEKNRVELASQSDREKAIRDELERRDEAEMLAKESFSSIRQEMDAKKQLIRQVLIKIRTMRDDIESTQKSYRLELDELDQLQYVLQKEFKLKCLIMDNFIPNNHVDNLLPHIVFDEKKNCCNINSQDLSLDYCNLDDQQEKLLNFQHPFSDGSSRPRSEFERICETIYPGNIRYKCENLIEPKLEVLSCGEKRNLTEQDTGAVELSISPAASRMQSLIDSALSQHDPDIVI